ncbi:hypothetical protein C1645_820935 [Glomus cerebriforme]|uniref:F-box domain-containing protein n=1 Tax=Glomus cerebriforme TaxID=658196 RepID=A0A397T352_9GLOM|nr:hypothetical protein C1645_820935 [Glomus cerebriforme]
MVQLNLCNTNVDVLYLIFGQLQDDKKSLRSCLLVNKTWCKLVVPILWKDPWKFLKWGKEILLLSVIISHLSEESKNEFCQDINFLKSSYQKPLFNYISFCRHLNLNAINRIIDTIYIIIYSKSKISFIKNKIINLFISENTKFTHLYIPYQFDFQIHLIPGAELCFSKIEFLSFNTCIDDNVLTGLTKICKSIKELELFISRTNNNDEIIKLIETPNKLLNIRLIILYGSYSKNDDSFCKILENSLIKHSNTIQYFKITKHPITKLLSSFINLKILELDDDFRDITWDCLQNLSLPYLQILKASRVPIKALTSLIENTNGCLIEIKIDYIPHNENDNKRIIQTIYQNCPNLKYLKLLFRNSNNLELEKLLINCQYLSGLYIIINNMEDEFDWDYLFKILTKSSPISLFKFKFSIYSDKLIKLESLKSFFDNWKGRHPMLLQIISSTNIKKYYYLIEKYKLEGIVKKYDYDTWFERTFEDFEWV